MTKNRFIKFAMVAASIGMLASCGGKTASSSSSSSSAAASSSAASSSSSVAPSSTSSSKAAPVIPSEDGKVTFYFEMKSSTPAIPSYVSPFLTGAMAEDAKGNWATSPTGTPSAVEMKLLADSNIYYGFAAYDPDTYTGKQAGEYQLTLGYNSTAEVSDDAKGISWGNKSDVCSGYSGLLNPSFTLSADKKSCDLGEHGWEAAGIPSKPVVLKNYTLQFNLDAAVPTGNKVYLAGSWNAWNTGDLANELCTLSADRKTVTKVMTSVLCSTYKYDLLYEADDATALTWNHKSDSCFVADGAYTPKASQGDKYTLNIADGFNEALNFEVTIKAVISDVARRKCRRL
jgi:hypothetical protein